MNRYTIAGKRFLLYVVGLFFLSAGVALSIVANLGVSPVSSLSYAISLTTGFSVGLTTIFAHILFIIIQVLLLRRFDWKDSTIQLIIAFLFGFFIDANLFLFGQFLPKPGNMIIQLIYLVISLFSVAGGLFAYSAPKFTLMPYDELTKVISEVFKMPFGQAKMIGDVTNVIVAASICLIFLRNFGSIGIGTIVAAVTVGKILEWSIKHFQDYVDYWLDPSKMPSNKPIV